MQCEQVNSSHELVHDHMERVDCPISPPVSGTPRPEHVYASRPQTTLLYTPNDITGTHFLNIHVNSPFTDVVMPGSSQRPGSK